jgi:hypothetical protein
MVTVPTRSAAAFAVSESPTLPLPLPLAPEVTVMKALLLTAVQVQYEAAVTPTAVAAPPAADAVWPAALSAKVHAGAAACVTTNTSPPTAIVPARSAPVFIATAYVIVALPLPVADAVLTVSQGTELVAVHEQFGIFVESVNESLPALAGSVCASGDTVNVQPGAC